MSNKKEKMKLSTIFKLQVVTDIILAVLLLSSSNRLIFLVGIITVYLTMVDWKKMWRTIDAEAKSQ